MKTLLATLVVLVTAGCGGQDSSTSGNPLTCDGTGSSCSCYSSPTGTNLLAPTVSFKSDVVPLFHNYCDSCHNSATLSGSLFLGTVGSPSDASSIYGGLVGKPGADLSQMNLVTAGDWTQSFLMHKLDGDQCGFAEACSVSNCGTLMPQGNTTPPPSEIRDTIRRWIQQGAVND
jgi:hypothetical protein